MINIKARELSFILWSFPSKLAVHINPGGFFKYLESLIDILPLPEIHYLMLLHIKNHGLMAKSADLLKIKAPTLYQKLIYIEYDKALLLSFNLGLNDLYRLYRIDKTILDIYFRCIIDPVTSEWEMKDKMGNPKTITREVTIFEFELAYKEDRIYKIFPKDWGWGNLTSRRREARINLG